MGIHFAADPIAHMNCGYMLAYYLIALIFLLFLIIFYTQWLFENAKPEKNNDAKTMIDDKSIPLQQDSVEDDEGAKETSIEMNETFVQTKKKRISFLNRPLQNIVRRHSSNGN